VSHPDDTPHTRRVRLPSGREIEVVYFDTGDLTTQDKQQKPKGQQELHICPECDRDRVYPVEWEEVSATEWEVLLRCPECEWTKVGVFDQATPSPSSTSSPTSSSTSCRSSGAPTRPMRLAASCVRSTPTPSCLATSSSRARSFRARGLEAQG
jgi:hypothetical protein